jgi:hypothetical protein
VGPVAADLILVVPVEPVEPAVNRLLHTADMVIPVVLGMARRIMVRVAAAVPVVPVEMVIIIAAVPVAQV